MFTAIVVDDEPYAREELIYILSLFPQCQIVGQASSAGEAISVYKNVNSDVVFLDIEMPDLSGIETAKLLMNFNKKPLIIFATAYDDYAIEAFELGAFDYILKPFDEKRIAKTVSRIENLRKNIPQWADEVKKISEFLNSSISLKKLPVYKNDGIINLIPLKDILFCEAYGKNVKVVTQKDEYFYEGTLSELENRLKREGFLRIHKSYVVNLKRIESVIPWFKGTYWVVLEGQKAQIPVSKAMIKELKFILGIKCSS